MSSSISTPAQLAEELKRSGKFDQFRKSLIAEFQSSSDKNILFAQLDELLSKRLSVPSLKTKNQQFTSLNQEIESKQVLLNTSNEIQKRMSAGEELSPPNESGLGSEYGSHIEKELRRLLKESRGEMEVDETPIEGSSKDIKMD